jgi:polysaccharide biosynthesis/export protein
MQKIAVIQDSVLPQSAEKIANSQLERRPLRSQKQRKTKMTRIMIATALTTALLGLASGVAARERAFTSSQENPVSQKLSTSQVDPTRPVLEQRFPRYKIQRDDAFVISFPISPEFNQKVSVQPDGYINLQGVGGLHVEGMTVPEVVEAVKTKYSKILHDPIVDVDLTDFQKPFFVVSGQVTKPGQYNLRYDTTISEAIAIAGGFAPTAKTQVLLYHRISPGLVQVKRVNLKAILNGKNVEEDMAMHPGDMVFVPEKFITNFRKYIPYSFGMYLNPSTALF